MCAPLRCRVSPCCSASQDPGALQRAEWVKFVGMFFNRELQAERLYDDVAATYTALKEAASAVGGRLAHISTHIPDAPVRTAQLLRRSLKMWTFPSIARRSLGWA